MPKTAAKKTAIINTIIIRYLYTPFALSLLRGEKSIFLSSILGLLTSLSGFGCFISSFAKSARGLGGSTFTGT